MEVLPQIIVSGVLIGLLYALIATGLTIIYGVMDMINFAHGAFLMLSMFIAYWLSTLLNFDPLLSLPICAAAIFILSWMVYKFIIKKVLDAPPVAQIFATFGVMVFLQNLALFLWSPDFRTVKDPLIAGDFSILSVNISVPKLIAAIGSLITTLLILWFMSRTKTGRSLKATAINREAAQLMGINTDRMFALAWGIGGACVGIAGALLVNFYYVFPEVGATFNLLAFVTVALGGFGSVIGTLFAGVMIGIVENLAGFFIAPALKYAVVFTMFIIVLVVRPQGLLGGR